MTTAWISNTTLDTIATELRDASTIVLLTHEKPDGDAVGSTLALARALTRIGISATPVFIGAWSPRFDPIVKATRVMFLDNDPDLSALPEPDRIVITDTGSWSQLAKVRPWLESRTSRAIVIDHHLHGDGDTAPMRHIETAVAAVCQTIAELCRLLLCVDRVNELPAFVAEPLYLGLATDTGWFRHSNVTPDVLRMAADLIEAGADHAKLYRLTEQMDDPCRLKLIGRALASMELHANNAAATIVITHDDLKECGANQDDTGGLTDILLTMAPVRVGATLIEVSDTRTKISFRSKTGSNGLSTVDVNQIARQLGGGGHAQAAGARVDMPIAQARQRVAALLSESLS